MSTRTSPSTGVERLGVPSERGRFHVASRGRHGAVAIETGGLGSPPRTTRGRRREATFGAGFSNRPDGVAARPRTGVH